MKIQLIGRLIGSILNSIVSICRYVFKSTSKRTANNKKKNSKRKNYNPDADMSRLRFHNASLLLNINELISFLNITEKQLYWFSHFYEQHYTVITVKKKSGGVRVIYAPKQRLKAIQRRILAEILTNVQLHKATHGFVKKRSIITNARLHTAKEVILNFDLKNFFDSIALNKVVYAFRWIGYSEDVSLALAKLCSVGRQLRQGLPTSPTLTNIVCYRLDKRLQGLADKFGCTYTRYADDITFSGDRRFKSTLERFIPLVKKILASEGFIANKQKMRIVRKSNRQEVTGLTVNSKVSVSRSTRRRWRAMVHNCVVHGPNSQNRNNIEYFKEHVEGVVAFVKQVEPSQARVMIRELTDVQW